MNNYQQRGDTLTLTAPAGGVTSGKPVKVGALVVVPMAPAAAGELFEGVRVGVFTVTVALTGAVNEGDAAYLKADGSAITDDATGTTLCGAFSAALASDAVSGDVLLTGQVA